MLKRRKKNIDNNLNPKDNNLTEFFKILLVAIFPLKTEFRKYRCTLHFSNIFSEGSAAEVSAEEDHDSVQTKIKEIHEVDGLNNSQQSTEIQAEVDEETAEGIENVGSSESEAPVSERAASGFSDNLSVGSPRVQFEKIKEEDAPNVQTSEAPTAADAPSNHEEDRKCRRHQKHEHK